MKRVVRRRFGKGKTGHSMTLNKTHFEEPVAKMFTKSVFQYAGATPGWCDSDEVEIASVNGGSTSFTVAACDFSAMMLAVLASGPGDYMPGLSQPYQVKFVKREAGTAGPARSARSAQARVARSAGSTFSCDPSREVRCSAEEEEIFKQNWTILSKHWIHATATIKDAVRAIPLKKTTSKKIGVQHFLDLPTDAFMLSSHSTAFHLESLKVRCHPSHAAFSQRCCYPSFGRGQGVAFTVG